VAFVLNDALTAFNYAAAFCFSIHYTIGEYSISAVFQSLHFENNCTIHRSGGARTENKKVKA
jgi:hypothetical protein